MDNDHLTTHLNDDATKVMVEFLPDALCEEMQRGIMMRETLSPQRSTAHRLYTQAEQQQLPIALRDYLFHLEQQGHLSPPQREWVIDSLLVNAARLKLTEIPLSLLVATLFIILGLQPGPEGSNLTQIARMREVSLQVH